MKQMFNANIVYLALLNQQTMTIHFPYQYGDDMSPMKLGEGLTSKIILSGQSLLINKDVQELRKQLGVQRVGIPAASYLGMLVDLSGVNETVPYRGNALQFLILFIPQDNDAAVGLDDMTGFGQGNRTNGRGINSCGELFRKIEDQVDLLVKIEYLVSQALFF